MTQKVLIVEDCKAHREVLQKILNDLHINLEIYCASDIKKAFEISMEQHIHLFLVDIVLDTLKPGDVSGLNFVREIRGVDKYRFTPVIFITLLEDPKLYSYSNLHCFGYMEKPFKEEEVKEMVLDALKFPIHEEGNKCVYFRIEGIVYAKYIKEILYITISRRKSVIHCMDDELEIPNMTGNTLMKELDSDLLVPCSRYSVINKMHIDKIDYANRFVWLEHVERPIEIGVIMKKAFMQRMNDE